MISAIQRKQLIKTITHTSTTVGKTTVWKTFNRGVYVGDVWRAPGRKYRHWTNSRHARVGFETKTAFDNRMDASLDLLGYAVPKY
jgi:hypothetical protein